MRTTARKSAGFSHVVDLIEGIYNGLQPAVNILVLIGGCSRSGKSTVAQQLGSSLVSRGVDSILVPADHWLFPASQRQAGTTVLKRYRHEELSDSVISLLRGQTISVKPYDAKTRELNPRSIAIGAKPTPFVVIVEGVITLAVRQLREFSALNIFVESGDCTRVRRLISFYRDFKLMGKLEYKELIKDREIEEVPFIKSTMQFADIIF